MVTNHLDGEGITVANVATGPTIDRAPFSFRPVSQAFDELAEQIGYSWWIDEDKDLHFVPRGTDVASLSFTPTSRDFIRLSKKRTLEKYYNTVTQIGGTSSTNTLTETLIGDGTRRVFNVAFKVDSKPSSIVAAGVTILASEIGIKGLDTGKKWYWGRGDAEIEQDSSETVLSNVETVVIQYKGQFPVIAIAVDNPEIATRAAASAGTSGRYETVLVDRSLDDLSIAVDKAIGYLRRFGTVPEEIKFTTRNQTLRPGQLMSIELPELAINGQYLIDSINYSDFGDDTFIYSVVALSGESLGGWQAFWKRLTKPDNLLLGDSFIMEVVSLPTTCEQVITATVTEDLNPLWTFDVSSFNFASIANQGAEVSTVYTFGVSNFNDGAGIAA